MLKKTFVSIIAVVLVFSCLTGVASAATVAQSYTIEVETTEADGEMSVSAEETEWYLRVFEGRLQKRLWSNTYGKWLTDWMDV